ncbi:MAG TPA: hypothetical protein VET48_04190, partial [Steroidobacteraceae bacterium]|nr:hypothetical protein [Steroidobacteraceae bacterium]
VSKDGLQRLLSACDEVYKPLRRVYDQSGEVTLDRTLARRMSVESWSQELGKFELLAPTAQNINDWLRIIDGWVAVTTSHLTKLRLAALDQLLLVEAQIAKFVRDAMQPGAAPEATRVPEQYPVLLPGGERKRQKQLDAWGRFQTADGVIPMLARLVVAAGIVGAVLFVGGSVDSASVTIYNGLARSVDVAIGTAKIHLRPFANTKITIPGDSHYSVQTSTDSGAQIEKFDAPAAMALTNYVYNIASASPLVEWTAVYGSGSAPPARPLGAPRWTTTDADYVFAEPPQQINTKRGGDTRTFLSSTADASPQNVLAMLKTDRERDLMAAAHAQWDDTRSRYILDWLHLATHAANFKAIIASRLREAPNDPVLLRAEQEAVSGEAHASVCARHRALVTQSPNNSDLQYIAARCIDDGAERDRAFLEGHNKWPQNGWLALAAGYVHAEQARWSDAQRALDQARRTVRPAASFVAMDLARIRRMTADGSRVTLNDLFGDSEWLRFADDAEFSANLASPAARSYQQLALGHFAQAMQAAKQVADPDSAPRMLRLLAASDGADKSFVSAALALSREQGIDPDSVWAALALAIREHIDPKPYIEIIKQTNGDDAAIALRFIDAVEHGSNADDTTLRGANPRTRGLAYGVAAVIVGKRAPTAWRYNAKRLLFATERPYFE